MLQRFVQQIDLNDAVRSANALEKWHNNLECMHSVCMNLQIRYLGMLQKRDLIGIDLW